MARWLTSQQTPIPKKGLFTLLNFLLQFSVACFDAFVHATKKCLICRAGSWQVHEHKSVHSAGHSEDSLHGKRRRWRQEPLWSREAASGCGSEQTRISGTSASDERRRGHQIRGETVRGAAGEHGVQQRWSATGIEITWPNVPQVQEPAGEGGRLLSEHQAVW